MEQINKIIEILLNNFDISYMLSINILTYVIIKIIDFINKDKELKLIYKRLILIICTIFCCILYKHTTNITNYVLINSTIAAPVFYSWVMKPILIKYNLNYFKENENIKTNNK